jgi:hypothetical protein
MVSLKRCADAPLFAFVKGGENMARTTKKPTKTAPVAKPKLTCVSCKKELSMDRFYLSNNELHKNNDNRFPSCKPCVLSTIDYDNVQTVYDLLAQMNRPFLQSLWQSTVIETNKSGKDLFGIYYKNVILNHKHLTWKESSFIAVATSDKSESINEDSQMTPTKKVSTFMVTEDLIDKWGSGYTNEEYKQFEKKYGRLINNYGEKTALHTEGLLTYIRYRVKEEMATAANQVREAKEWGTLASKAAQDAKINVSQLSKSDISGGVDVLSQLFEAVESEVGVIPLLPHLLEQPYDDADMVIWATVNYNRRLEDKPAVPYRDIWEFYDEMLGEYFSQQGFNDDQIKEFKAKRNNVFRDLSQIYKEPLYESDGE